MQQLVVRIPAQQKQLFEQLARQQDTTISLLVRQALDNFLEKKLTMKKKNFLLELAKIGHGASGPKDLSSTYKRHLYHS